MVNPVEHDIMKLLAYSEDIVMSNMQQNFTIQSKKATATHANEDTVAESYETIIGYYRFYYDNENQCKHIFEPPTIAHQIIDTEQNDIDEDNGNILSFIPQEGMDTEEFCTSILITSASLGDKLMSENTQDITFEIDNKIILETTTTEESKFITEKAEKDHLNNTIHNETATVEERELDNEEGDKEDMDIFYDPLNIGMWPNWIWSRTIIHHMPSSGDLQQYIRAHKENGYVLYWVRRCFRIQNNLALQMAIWLATQLSIPVVVLHLMELECYQEFIQYQSSPHPQEKRSTAETSLHRKSATRFTILNEFRNQLHQHGIPFISKTYTYTKAFSEELKTCHPCTKILHKLCLSAAFGNSLHDLNHPFNISSASTALALFCDDGLHPLTVEIVKSLTEITPNLAIFSMDSNHLITPKKKESLIFEDNHSDVVPVLTPYSSPYIIMPVNHWKAVPRNQVLQCEFERWYYNTLNQSIRMKEWELWQECDIFNDNLKMLQTSIQSGSSRKDASPFFQEIGDNQDQMDWNLIEPQLHRYNQLDTEQSVAPCSPHHSLLKGMYWSSINRSDGQSLVQFIFQSLSQSDNSILTTNPSSSFDHPQHSMDSTLPYPSHFLTPQRSSSHSHVVTPFPFETGSTTSFNRVYEALSNLLMLYHYGLLCPMDLLQRIASQSPTDPTQHPGLTNFFDMLIYEIYQVDHSAYRIRNIEWKVVQTVPTSHHTPAKSTSEEATTTSRSNSRKEVIHYGRTVVPWFDILQNEMITISGKGPSIANKLFDIEMQPNRIRNYHKLFENQVTNTSDPVSLPLVPLYPLSLRLGNSPNPTFNRIQTDYITHGREPIYEERCFWIMYLLDELPSVSMAIKTAFLEYVTHHPVDAEDNCTGVGSFLSALMDVIEMRDELIKPNEKPSTITNKVPDNTLI